MRQRRFEKSYPQSVEKNELKRIFFTKYARHAKRMRYYAKQNADKGKGGAKKLRPFLVLLCDINEKDMLDYLATKTGYNVMSLAINVKSVNAACVVKLGFAVVYQPTNS